MYYLIWLCVTCSNNTPVNLGLYDKLSACEEAKQEVVTFRESEWARKMMKCISKGGMK